MEVFVNLLIAAAFGGVCAAVANSRGRNAVGWFFIGFFLSCIGVVLVLVLPDLNQEQVRRQRLLKENRRLREQFKKDRHVSSARYADVNRRLDVHDHALELDTAPRADGPPELLSDEATAADAPGPDGERWWWVESGERRGPVAFEELARLWRGGLVDPDTLVWKSGMDEWTELEDVPGLMERLGG